MDGEFRVQVRKDGSLALPREALSALGAEPGSYLGITVADGVLTVRKIQFDPFAQPRSTPAPDAFDRILKRQKDGLVEAEKEFLDKLKEPPEVRPEDRPDFWR